MKEISKRLQKIVGDNVAQYAKELGMNRQTLDNYLKGRTPRADFLYALAKIKNININWLLTGEGERQLKSESKKELEKIYEKVEHAKVTDEEKQKLLSVPKSSRIRWKVCAPICAIIITIAGTIFGYFLLKDNLPTLLFHKGWKNSIAVLPFKDLSPQNSREYLCDGMTDAIIGKLSKIEELKVISRTSVMRYKDVSKDIKKIGKELEVATILEGSIQKENDSIRINVELIDANTGFHLWSETYDKKLSSIFEIQDEIAQEITNSMKIKLTGEDKATFAQGYTGNLEAYSLYLMGRFFWNKRTEEGLKKGLEYFQQAIEKDPNYALAYAGIADCYNILVDYSYLPPKDAYPRAKVAAEKALRIDNNLAEGYTSLAFVRKNYDRDWSAAERNYKQAIELKPSYATAHHWYAWYLMEMGRKKEALSEGERAQELDPLSLSINADFGILLYYAGKYDQAIEQLQQTLQMDPNFFATHWYLGLVYMKKGMRNEAIAEVQKAIELFGEVDTPLITNLGIMYSFAGMKDEAKKVLDDIYQLSKQKYVYPVSIAKIYAGLGQKDEAFEWLEKAYVEYDPRLIGLKVTPMLESLRSDPRYTTLLKKMNLE